MSTTERAWPSNLDGHGAWFKKVKHQGSGLIFSQSNKRKRSEKWDWIFETFFSDFTSWNRMNYVYTRIIWWEKKSNEAPPNTYYVVFSCHNSSSETAVRTASCRPTESLLARISVNYISRSHYISVDVFTCKPLPIMSSIMQWSWLLIFCYIITARRTSFGIRSLSQFQQY